MTVLEAEDRRLIAATEAGLPLTPRPFARIADEIGMSEADVIQRFDRLQRLSIVRRIAAAPNHYALGMCANGMSVWDVEDARVSELGRQVGNLPFVTHCYLRPRALPDWPYNLFAMVHGVCRPEVEEKRAEIERLLGSACRAADILYSTRILKKTGLRLSKSGA